MSEGQQPQDVPAPVDGGMVRACDRCGTICSADQEWCLACGVRMSAVSQRLPGLRAAGVVVSLAVLLAGGAAAASYAALRSDSTTTAAAPAGPAGTPVAPATTPPPVTPQEDPLASAPTDEALPPVDEGELDDFDDVPDPGLDDVDLGDDLPTDVPDTSFPETPTTDAPLDSGGDETDATDSTDSTDSSDSADDTDTTEDETGLIELASGQGSLYDPDGVVADRGDESRAIDGNVKTSWQAKLVEGKTGGFGYVLDFDSPVELSSMIVHTQLKGQSAKVLGTTRKTLPLSVTDAQWVELAGTKSLKTGSSGTTFTLDAADKKLRHVVLLITVAPGAPAASQIHEIQVSH